MLYTNKKLSSFDDVLHLVIANAENKINSKHEMLSILNGLVLGNQHTYNNIIIIEKYCELLLTAMQNNKLFHVESMLACNPSYDIKALKTLSMCLHKHGELSANLSIEHGAMHIDLVKTFKISNSVETIKIATFILNSVNRPVVLNMAFIDANQQKYTDIGKHDLLVENETEQIERLMDMFHIQERLLPEKERLIAQAHINEAELNKLAYYIKSWQFAHPEKLLALLLNLKGKSFELIDVQNIISMNVLNNMTQFKVNHVEHIMTNVMISENDNGKTIVEQPQLNIKIHFDMDVPNVIKSLWGHDFLNHLEYKGYGVQFNYGVLSRLAIVNGCLDFKLTYNQHGAHHSKNNNGFAITVFGIFDDKRVGMIGKNANEILQDLITTNMLLKMNEHYANKWNGVWHKQKTQTIHTTDYLSRSLSALLVDFIIEQEYQSYNIIDNLQTIDEFVQQYVNRQHPRLRYLLTDWFNNLEVECVDDIVSECNKHDKARLTGMECINSNIRPIDLKLNTDDGAILGTLQVDVVYPTSTMGMAQSCFLKLCLYPNEKNYAYQKVKRIAKTLNVLKDKTQK